ncbi:RNA binding [Cordyceps militaris]|uniref:RNA binding n=1 Tax=Cordyceps militaris TaxID=73501 RepID=A0A2H4SE58_CORMI|nr:RNA binding [Cordyceps militaris]
MGYLLDQSFDYIIAAFAQCPDENLSNLSNVTSTYTAISTHLTTQPNSCSYTMALALPMHNLPMDEPAASEVFEYNNQTFYCWKLSETERAHIASMLNMDATDLKLKGNNFLQDRSQCSGCGKHSGMDDFVHNALFAGIHSVEFMKDFLLGKTEQATPYTEHEVTCSRCSTKHDETKSWLAYPPWPRY